MSSEQPFEECALHRRAPVEWKTKKVVATANDGGTTLYACGCVDHRPAIAYWAARGSKARGASRS